MSSRRNHKVITVIMLVLVFLPANALLGASEKELAIPVIVNKVSYEQRLKIDLDENTSTGYTWHYYLSDNEAFSLYSKEVSGSQPEETSPGASSAITWFFTPESIGSSAIIFKLFREWEGQESAVDIRVYNVEVEDTTLNECVPQYTMVLSSSSGSVEVGRLTRISLQENPSTGFSWTPKTDGSALRYIGKTVASDSSSSGSIQGFPNSVQAVGSPTTVFFDFEGIRKGISLIEFTYSRPWESNEDPMVAFAGVSVE